MSFYFPDLKSLGNYWDTLPYKIGLIALIEGAGKAAEWIYDLHRNPSMEEKAWKDIEKSPEIYKLALNRLRSSITGLGLLHSAHELM